MKTVNRETETYVSKVAGACIKKSNDRATIKQELPRLKVSFGSALRHAGPQDAPMGSF